LEHFNKSTKEDSTSLKQENNDLLLLTKTLEKRLQDLERDQQDHYKAMELQKTKVMMWSLIKIDG
jgi:hypothetical protein